MADQYVILPVMQLVYNLYLFMADSVWQGYRALVLSGAMVELANIWVVTRVFGPSIQSVADLNKGLLPLTGTVAMFVLGLTYVLSPILKVQVVNWNKAVPWMIGGLIFFQAAPELYTGFELAREGVSNAIHEVVAGKAMGADSIIGGVGTTSDLPPLPSPTSNFGVTGTDGIDIAIAYAYATKADITDGPEDLPPALKAAFFPEDTAADSYRGMTMPERYKSLRKAQRASTHLLTDFPIIIFGVLEHMISLMLTIAIGIMFINLAVAIPLAVFEVTEPLAKSALDGLGRLFVFTVIAAVFQSLIVGIVISLARAYPVPELVIGASFIGLLVMAVLLFRSFSAIGDSTNQLFQASSQISGGRMMSPAELGGAVAGGVASAALAVASGGVTLAAGGTLTQAAGSALSGSDMFYGAAAIGSMALPDDSKLKGFATEAHEGAIASRMLGPLGGAMLGAKQEAGGGHQTSEIAQMETSGVRAAVGLAIAQAVDKAPPGGYGNQLDALTAVREALGGLAKTPSVDSYLKKNGTDICQHVMTQSEEDGKPLTVNVNVKSNEETSQPIHTNPKQGRRPS